MMGTVTSRVLIVIQKEINMCAVSMITDHFRDKWPVQHYINITQAQWDEYQALKRKMEEYDKKTGQPDCVKPEVADWEKAIEDVLRKKGLI
jgi:hypothetical protein